MPSWSGGRRRTRAALLGLGVVLAVAFVLRVVFASRKGLVLDEFHTYFHATRAGFDVLFETLFEDNHPPLSFLVVGAARSLVGESELALRAPAIAFGLVEIVLVWILARRILGPVPATVAAGLLSLSSLHLDFSTQARMYALHALAVTGVVEALVATIRTPAGKRAIGPGVRLALWTVVGAHNHYFFLQYLGILGAVAVMGVVVSRELRPLGRRLAGPWLVALLVSLPWYATGFRSQLAHELPPGGDDLGLRALAEAFVHLFYLNVRIGGPVLRVVFIAGGGVVLALGVYGVATLVASRRSAAERLETALIVATAFVVPVAATVVATVLPRAGFTWHYILPSAAATAILAAAALGRGPLATARRGAAGFVAASALLLCVLNAASRGTEDYRGAVRAILVEHRPGDAVISVEWQPALFPQGQPWDYYAPRLTGTGEAPVRLPMNEHFSLADPRDLASAERVFLLRTALPLDQHLMRLLGERFVEMSRDRFGFRPEVHVFEPR